MTKRKTVLLIEDDCVLLDLNKRVLERERYRVLAARNLKEGRELAAAENPRIVILDINLPDGNGVEFCRELRKTENIPIIFLTALTGEENEKAGCGAGADDYITKPYSVDRLINSIKTLTERIKVKEEQAI
jgi:DNA-binding response OmpR family regulator